MRRPVRGARGAATLALFLVVLVGQVIGGWAARRLLGGGGAQTQVLIDQARVKHCDYAQKNYRELAAKGLLTWKDSAELTNTACAGTPQKGATP